MNSNDTFIAVIWIISAVAVLIFAPGAWKIAGIIMVLMIRITSDKKEDPFKKQQ